MAEEAFIGRERELAELRDVWEAARAHRGRLVLITGEPGIGKSRLVDRFASDVRNEGTPVLAGRCWEAGGAPAYWPWVQILRTRVRTTERETLRHELGPGAVDVAQMLPEIRELFPDVGQPPSVDPESARFRLFDSVATFLRHAGDDQPIVVTLEDLHAADVPSILLLRFLTGQLTDIATVVLATYREVELTPDHPIRSSLSELARDPTTRRLALSGLSEQEVGRFIDETTGLAPSPLFVSALHRETNGNPLFVVEAMRLLAAEGRLADPSDVAPLRVGVPDAVGGVIARRLGRLDDQGRRILEVASVLGSEFPVEALARLADLPTAGAVEALDRALADGLLERVVAFPGRLRFSHGLVRESLYGGIGTGRRVTLHRRAAGVLEELYGGDAAHLAELAHHWFEAAATGDTAAAIDYAVRAADQAAASLAYEEAVRLYGMAAQLIEVSGPLDEERLGEVLLALGEAEARAGDLPDSQATMLRVAALARRTGAASQLGRAALGYGGRFIFTRAGHDARLIPLLEQALAAQEDDDGLRVRLLARLACALRGHPDREHAAQLSREALEIARRLHDPRALAYALAGRLFAYWWPETVEERLTLAHEAFDVARRANDGEAVADALLGLLAAHSERCEIDDARAALATMAAQAESMRQPALDWVVRTQRCLFDLAEGSFAAAELAIEDERALSHTIPRDYISSRRFQLFLLRREQGRLAELEGVVRDSAEEFLWYPLWHRALTCLLLDLGRVDEAREIFGQALERFPLPRDNEWLLGMALSSEACAALGDRAAAEDLYREYLPFPDLMAAGNAEGWMGPVARYLGLLAAALGRHDEADAHFRHAEELAERMRMRPWLAHARHDRARMLLERSEPGDRDLAASLLRQALGTAERLGMVVLQGRIGGLLAELGELPSEAGDRAPSEVRPRPAGAEFRREGEYWSVAFEGEAFRLRDSKGMAHLSRLLAEPGREFHALDLVQGPGEPSEHASQREDVDIRIGAAALGDSGALLDPQAKEAYRRRVAELEEEIEDAESRGDADRAERARSEREFIARELASALGLGGRDRVAGSASERARVNVTRSIKASLARIAEQSPALGRHLEATVRTGTYCAYVPDPRVPVTWRV